MQKGTTQIKIFWRPVKQLFQVINMGKSRGKRKTLPDKKMAEIRIKIVHFV